MKGINGRLEVYRNGSFKILVVKDVDYVYDIFFIYEYGILVEILFGM